MNHFCCPKCGVVEPHTCTETVFAVPEAIMICAHCGQVIPCPTCYGRAEDYIVCWTCERVPVETPKLTDDYEIAAALQALVRSHFHVKSGFKSVRMPLHERRYPDSDE